MSHYDCDRVLLLLQCNLNHLWGSFTGDLIDEATSINVIRALDETIRVVLEYLQDAKVRLLLIALRYDVLPVWIHRRGYTGTWTKKRRWSSCFSENYWEVCADLIFLILFSYLSRIIAICLLLALSLRLILALSLLSIDSLGKSFHHSWTSFDIGIPHVRNDLKYHTSSYCLYSEGWFFLFFNQLSCRNTLCLQREGQRTVGVYAFGRRWRWTKV